MNLSTAAHILQATLSPSAAANAEFKGVSTDTRTLQPGELFIAIKGPTFDGHDFVAQAAEKRALAVMIENDCNVYPSDLKELGRLTPHETPQHSQAYVRMANEGDNTPRTSKAMGITLPCLRVENTIQAMGKLAAYHRDQFHIPMIGVTGSCGKTTTRALIGSILSECADTLFSISSFNNEIGVPLTLLRLQPQHQYAVIEMGANHFGEIAYLTHIVKPTVALITNAAAAHLEGFGSVAGVCKAKGEIFEGLASDGVAILNADDAHLSDWEKMITSQKILRFSLLGPADIYAKQISIHADGRSSFVLVMPAGEIQIHLPLLGRHNIANALAAAAAAYAVNAPLSKIKQGLEHANAVTKRLNILNLGNDIHIIDDTYNANPLSVLAAIHTLAGQSGEKILVLGDMRELGEQTDIAHRDIGKKAKQFGIDRLYTYGNTSELASEAFGENAQHFTDQAALIAALKMRLLQPVTVLVKGSRSMKMEQIVAALAEKNDDNC